MVEACRSAGRQVRRRSIDDTTSHCDQGVEGRTELRHRNGRTTGSGHGALPPRAPEVRTSITIAAWRELLLRDSEAAWRIAVSDAESVVRRQRRGSVDPDDLASEVVWLCFGARAPLLSRARGDTKLADFLAGIARNVERRLSSAARLRHDHEQRSGGGRSRSRLEPAEADADLGDRLSPRWTRLRRRVMALDSPYRQIAALRLQGATRNEVASYLKAWRPVSDSECLRLWKRTSVLLRRLLADDDAAPPTRRPGSRENSRWKATPPPHDDRL